MADSPDSNAAAKPVLPCELEPIQTPGAIQPHGVMLVVDRRTWRVVGASVNSREFFWREASALIGLDLASVLSDEFVEALQRVAARPEFSGRASLVDEVEIDLGGERSRFAIVAHGVGDLVIVEGEPAGARGADNVETILQAFLARLGATAGVEELQDLVVREIRRITGFDRCLLYRFEPDWHGVVIAEDRNDRLPSYLHQRFPASDIPRQARELYRRNRLRIIPTNRYTPVPIVMQRDRGEGTAVNLSLSVLRSVSPIHLEFMRNMGTAASFSISIVRGDTLWGLISLHHATPAMVPFDVRSVCDLIGQIVSHELSARETVRTFARRLQRSTLVERLLVDMHRAGGVVGANTADLAEILGADGVALWTDGVVQTHGQCPPEDVIEPLVRWTLERAKPVAAWDRLGEAYASGGDLGATRGALALRLDDEGKVGIVGFRNEWVRVIQWAGDPRKTPADDPGKENDFLHPRKSFATWQETVSGSSRAWGAEHLSAASRLRDSYRGLIAAPAGGATSTGQDE